jgi:hypothetical protein
MNIDVIGLHLQLLDKIRVPQIAGGLDDAGHDGDPRGAQWAPMPPHHDPNPRRIPLRNIGG